MTPPLPLRTILQPSHPEVWGFSLEQCIDYGKACAEAEQDRILRIVHEVAGAYGKAGECMRISIRAKVHSKPSVKEVCEVQGIALRDVFEPKPDWSAA